MGSDKNILYIFGSGREEKIVKNNLDSSEFFYGFFHLKSKFKNVNSIEMLPNDSVLKKHQFFLNFIDKVLRKLTNLPFYTHLITSKNNYSKIKKADLILSTNDRLAISALPMFIFTKFKSPKKLLVVVMGLFSKKRGHKIVHFLQKITLNFIIKKIDYLIFLGNGEYELAKKMYPKFKEKFIFIPFGLNLDFWKPSKKYSPKNKDYILFVGNDGNRDFDKVLQIANSIDKVNIKIITNQNFSKKSINDNVEIIYGDWHKTALTDLELKNYYENALLTFLPLKETYQPSGQSVTLQSMSLGTPVIITKTNGFWEPSKFENYKNIVFLEENNVDKWVEIITSISKNEKLLNEISSNSITTIKQFYDQNEFFNKIYQLI